MVPEINLLLLKKDLPLCSLINESSTHPSFTIDFLESGQDILNVIKLKDINAILVDLETEGKTGKNIIKTVRFSDAFTDIIVLGPPRSSDETIDIINLGASYYIHKPVDPKTLDSVFQNIIDIRMLRKDTLQLEKSLEEKYLFHGIIGKSPDMLEIFSLLEKIAKHFSVVLITGESGTGKELVASAIHKLSRARSKDLIICDCVSIPENLFESELFGHTKGAFTGADKDRPGLFETAHNGIIFLDEIGEVPVPIQAKLLRVLEQHTFRSLGSNEVKSVDVRIIAATNRNLTKAIKEGTFREDLFHRLNKIVIHMPRLQERPEDIPLLIRHFIEGFSKKFNKKLRGASREVQKFFLRYDWPGNVRELENVLERAAILTDKDFIDIIDLPKYLQNLSQSEVHSPTIDHTTLRPLAEIEKDYIRHVLNETNNNLRQAAKILNVARNTLYNKIKKYNIPY